jgi:hypothetical protein
MVTVDPADEAAFGWQGQARDVANFVEELHGGFLPMAHGFSRAVLQ